MNLTQIIKHYNPEWDGFLYRSGQSGIFYHTSLEGAQFYGNNIKKYKPPQTNKIIVIDIDHVGPPSGNIIGLETIGKLIGKTIDEVIEMDLALAIEEALPKINADAVIIYGDTGAEVQGVPVEVVYWNKLVEIPLSPEEISQLIT